MKPPPQLARSVDARDDHPVVAGDVDRLAPERLDLDQRTDDRLVAELLEAAHELRFLTARPRDEDPHRTAASSSAATASASLPLRRSIQAPSSSATSAVSVLPS